MRFQFGCCLLVVLSQVFLAPISVAIGDEPNDDVKTRNAKLIAIYRAHAASYQMVLGPKATPLSLQPKPVFVWENRARVATPRIQTGGVFIWTLDGRAEVIGTVFSQKVGDMEPVMFHEFHSLATERIEAKTEQGVVHWSHREGGIKPKPFPDAETPAATPSRRLIQMRRLARRFNGYSINYDDKRWSLALLPQPVHRMAKSQDKILDGAVFTLMSTAGTDPEIILVIEARMGNDRWRWHYSVCRFTDLKTWVSFDEDPVWSFETGTRGPFIESGINDPYRFSSEGVVKLPAE